VHREAILTFSEITIGCSLIFAGFSGKRFPLLVETTEHCRVLVREDYATIGERSFLAQSVLLQRKHSDSTRLAPTIYIAYEAKKYAEEVNSVGKQTAMVVISPNDARQDIEAEGLVVLAEHFKNFGPQPISTDILGITKFVKIPSWIAPSQEQSF
jgi:hypothetical protein